MEKEILLGGKLVPYTLRESSRARRVNLTLRHDGSVVVSIPKRKKATLAENFLKENEKWVLANLKKIKNHNGIYLETHKGKKFELLKEYAQIFVNRKIEKINKYYKFKINRVSIKNQKSQWGSCSAKGNLNFTYKVVLLPERLAEYVIAHEICHIQEFSHSKAFWTLLGESVPNCRELDKELKRYHIR
jgi:predicted metal-dependent hydrolase